jgi:hypothetical protein
VSTRGAVLAALVVAPKRMTSRLALANLTSIRRLIVTSTENVLPFVSTVGVSSTAGGAVRNAVVPRGQEMAARTSSGVLATAANVLSARSTARSSAMRARCPCACRNDGNEAMRALHGRKIGRNVARGWGNCE